jgi:hypothetical protein
MNRSPLPLALTAAAAFALAVPAGAVTVTLPDIQVLGADSVCSGFTVGSANGVTTLTCIPIGGGTPPPATAPQGCVARINNSTTATLSSSGGSVNLSVVCSSPTTLSYNWSKNGTAGANANANWTDTLGANTGSSNLTTSYRVTVCNTAGTSADCVTVPSTPLTAVVQAATGGGGGTIACASKVLDVDWNAPGRYFTYNAGGFAPTDTFVVRFKAGSVPFTSLARFSGAEYGSSPSARIATLSPNPCDFSRQGSYGANILTPTNSLTFYFTVGTAENYTSYYPVLQTGKTYYINIQNAVGATCYTTGGCDMFIDFSKPRGT